jgi:Ca2+-binding RTX toxin-like protein
VRVDDSFGSFSNDALTVDGGAGNNVLRGGGGSDTVEGQGGHDTLQFNGSNVAAAERIGASVNGSRVQLARDVGGVNMDLAGVETLNLAARGGADTITIGDLAGTALKAANVDLSGSAGTGDGQPDTVIANGIPNADHVHVNRSANAVQLAGLPSQTTITGSDGPSDTLRVNTLAGKDTVSMASDVGQLITPIIDLGTDQ